MQKTSVIHSSGEAAPAEMPAADKASAPVTVPAPSVVPSKETLHAYGLAPKPRRTYESFEFDPNTVSAPDLERLGFSTKQAESIINYREKGGRFHRAEDFSKSYVVSDTLFERLRPFIRIPLLDINAADSCQFDALPGIGPYFAGMMVREREALGGYVRVEQLMLIRNFGKERFDALSDLVCCSAPQSRFDIWSASEEELSAHPYIRSGRVALAIVRFRDNNPREEWRVESLLAAGVIDEELAGKLSILSSP